MENLTNNILEFIECCKYRKTADNKTIKAYSIDLEQYIRYMGSSFGKSLISEYMSHLHKEYNPKNC